jgi:RecB family endonuclease NucS
VIKPDEHSAFALYAECSVIYEGRARSELARGRYLIVHKPDGVLLIHNATGTPPVNYQGSKSRLTIDGNVIISQRKSERLVITIDHVIHHVDLEEWSENSIIIRDTEKDLVDKIEANWNSIITLPVVRIEREYPTKYGPIDLVGISSDDVHVIVEVKRGKASLNHCSQLNRYNEHFLHYNMKCIARLASPQIGANALKYLKDHSYDWVRVDFDLRT